MTPELVTEGALTLALLAAGLALAEAIITRRARAQRDRDLVLPWDEEARR